jgi:hypothetical protein
MRFVSRVLANGVLVFFPLVSGAQNAAGETRVLFVGNSVSSYHGLPYVFEEVASDLYGAQVQVDTWAQAGGFLTQAAAQDDVLRRLESDPYDLVVLQESGGLLLCARGEDSASWSDRCKTSLDAHRRIIAAAAKDGSKTVLLGTYQMRPEAAAALDQGERMMQHAAAIDAHVPFATLFLEGRARYPDMPWLDSDGSHPGSAAVLVVACRIAGAAFESERLPPSRLQFFEPTRIPIPSFSYQSLARGTDAFVTGTESVLGAAQVANAFEICRE